MLAVGNTYEAESIAGQYDALTGLLLKGDGKGKFRPLLFPQSGLLADVDCKSIVGLNSATNRLFVASANKGPLQLFQSQRREQP